MKRTFIALELSDEIKEEFSRLQEELKEAYADVKWVDPENIHLTLKFLGNVEEDKIGQVKKVLDGISSRNKPFKISLSGLGAFPDLYKMRVIWVGIAEGCAETEKIAGLIEGELVKNGFPEESRAFRSHFTLGRVKTDMNKGQLKDKLTSLAVQPKSCVISHITLFQSTLTPQGPIYTPLHVAKFTGI